MEPEFFHGNLELLLTRNSNNFFWNSAESFELKVRYAGFKIEALLIIMSFQNH